MSLSKRLQQLTPQRGPSDCITCTWLDEQTPGDQQAFWEWTDAGHSRKQLQNECAVDGLNVSDTAFSRHVKNHRDRYLLQSPDVKQSA